MDQAAIAASMRTTNTAVTAAHRPRRGRRPRQRPRRHREPIRTRSEERRVGKECIKELSLEKYLSKEAATCIYTGIVTDSRSFKLVKTTGDTHRTVAELIDLFFYKQKTAYEFFT